jgi:hypothetical protein
MQPTKDRQPAQPPKEKALALLDDMQECLDAILAWDEDGRDDADSFFALYEVPDLPGMLGAVEYGLNDLRALVMEHLA